MSLPFHLTAAGRLTFNCPPSITFHIWLQFRIFLDHKWIPRDLLNSRAELISKIIDFNDYELNDVIFQGLDELWGPHSVDRFSCSYNAKLTRFNPKCSEAVDTFCQDLQFMCPPICLIVRVIKHLELCHARGTPIVTLCKSFFFLEFLLLRWSPLKQFCHPLGVPSQVPGTVHQRESAQLLLWFQIVKLSRPRPPSSHSRLACMSWLYVLLTII